MSSNIGADVENWVCYGMPSEPLTSEQREAIIDYASGFEERSDTREELQAAADHDLIRTAYWAMADYARGQM